MSAVGIPASWSQNITTRNNELVVHMGDCVAVYRQPEDVVSAAQGTVESFVPVLACMPEQRIETIPLNWN